MEDGGEGRKRRSTWQLLSRVSSVARYLRVALVVGAAAGAGGYSGSSATQDEMRDQLRAIIARQDSAIERIERLEKRDREQSAALLDALVELDRVRGRIESAIDALRLDLAPLPGAREHRRRVRE